MFGWEKNTGCSSIDTIVGQHTKLKGDIRFSGGLHIDGKVEGSITAEPGVEAVLTVSEQGCIEGDVHVPNLVLNGSVVGEVHVSGRVELASHAKVTGNLYYSLIEMAMGAEVNGNMVHCTEEPQRQKQANDRASELPDSGMAAAK
ncbi:Integral membrane protein CcmA involved in cell shape determination [hydrothermal vent metagenome]|uniref:Integral membrane protein CcmA involved in cell shape determination n=1 Tax=hydrothermal vent metagenome TaxID=652676 RepID=A0A3B0Y9J3_9ZZZZ